MKKFLSFFYRIALFSLAGVFILGQFGRFELPGARALYFQDVMLLVFCLVFFCTHRRSTLELVRTHLGKLCITVNVWILFGNILNFHTNIPQLVTATLYLTRFDVILFFGWAVKKLIQEKIITYRELQQWVTGSVLGIAVLGWAQYLFFPDTRGLQLLGWDDHYYRLISTIFDPGFTGIILTIGSIFILWKLLQKWTVGYTASFLLVTSALLFTYSRATYLAFIAGLLYLSIRTKKYVLLTLLPVFALCILLLPRPGGEGVKLERTASAVSRIESVRSSFSQFTRMDFFIGKGWYWKKEVQPTTDLHGMTVPNHSSAAENSYVFVFTSLGVVGVILWICFLYYLLRSIEWSVPICTVFVAIGIHALFTNTFFYPFVLILVAVIMAQSGRQYLAMSRSLLH